MFGSEGFDLDCSVLPPVEVTTSKRRVRAMNDTRATRGLEGVPAGKGPYRLRPSTTTAKVFVMAEPSGISRVMKATPVILYTCWSSIVMKARLPLPSEDH